MQASVSAEGIVPKLGEMRFLLNKLLEEALRIVGEDKSEQSYAFPQRNNPPPQEYRVWGRQGLKLFLGHRTAPPSRATFVPFHSEEVHTDHRDLSETVLEQTALNY